MANTAFISYSWDDDDHKGWARALAERLRSNGIDATLDQWVAAPGDQLPQLMERAIAGNQFVLVICSPRYKLRSENREGGVGYEGDIMTGELLAKRNHRKFIPILRRGERGHSVPNWLGGKYFIDLRDGSRYEAQHQDLLSTLLGTRPTAPPVGIRAGQVGRRMMAPVIAAETSRADEPIRILGVIADEVSEPRGDGSAGSALYAVPFRLSRAATGAWADVFVQVWNHPPQFTSMHRPGIARVSGDRVVLDGTTIDEVQRCHRDTLILCVKETNRVIDEHAEKGRIAATERERRSREHRDRINELSGKIRFDE
jgi:hypothetical protein